MINSWLRDKWCTLEGLLCDGTYDLTTKARQKVVDRNKQLEEGASRQIWKCLNPLNYVARLHFESLAHWFKYGTWVQIWTWHFWVRTVPSWTLDLGHTRDRPARSVSSQVHMVITSVSFIPVSLICYASLKGKCNMQGWFQYIYWLTWKNSGARIYCDYAGWRQGLARGIYSLRNSTYFSCEVEACQRFANLGWSGPLKRV